MKNLFMAMMFVNHAYLGGIHGQSDKFLSDVLNFEARGDISIIYRDMMDNVNKKDVESRLYTEASLAIIDSWNYKISKSQFEARSCEALSSRLGLFKVLFVCSWIDVRNSFFEGDFIRVATILRDRGFFTGVWRSRFYGDHPNVGNEGGQMFFSEEDYRFFMESGHTKIHVDKRNDFIDFHKRGGGGGIFVDAKINGYAAKFDFDTGTAVTTIGASDSSKWHVRLSSIVVSARDVSGKYRRAVLGMISSISVGGLSIFNLPVVVVSSGGKAILGQNFLDVIGKYYINRNGVAINTGWKFKCANRLYNAGNLSLSGSRPFFYVNTEFGRMFAYLDTGYQGKGWGLIGWPIISNSDYFKSHRVTYHMGIMNPDIRGGENVFYTDYDMFYYLNGSRVRNDFQTIVGARLGADMSFGIKSLDKISYYFDVDRGFGCMSTQ